MDHADRVESAKLRRMGTVVADGDFGELSVRVDKKQFRQAARLIKPRQAITANRAA